MLQSPRQASFTVAYELWLASWDTALAALTSASQSRTLSAHDAAELKTVIVDERRLVMRELTLLLGADVVENGARASHAAGR